MNKEKRNIAAKLETESKYLTNILDKQDVKEFKKLKKIKVTNLLKYARYIEDTLKQKI